MEKKDRSSNTGTVVRELGKVALLNYALYGDPESPAVLLLHGFMGSAEDWDSAVGSLSRDFFCVTLDLPGHDGSTSFPDKAYTIEDAAKAVLRLTDELGVENATFVGYSMGGRLALYLALRHPERCAGLFLESASPGIENTKERDARRHADEERARRLELDGFEAFLRDWYRQPVFASLASHEGLVEKLIESRTNNDPRELAKSLRGMGTGSQPSLWNELPGLKVPTLVVAGELDEKFVRISRRMASLSSNMRTDVIPEVGHNIHLETPEAYLALLREHLSGV